MISSAGPLDREPRLRVAGRDLGELRPLVAELRRGTRRVAPRGARAARVVEDRERQPRLEHVVRDLGRMERRLPWERPLLVRLERVRVPLTTPLERLLGRQRLRADDERDVELVAQDLLGQALHKHLRRRAADARVVPLLRLDLEPLRQTTRRIVVLPGLRVHDVDRIEPLQHRLADARVVGRGTRLTASHMISGSGAPSSPTSCLCQVSVPTPMMHGDRGSTATATSPASSACASPRRPSGPPWRPRSGRSRTRSRFRCGTRP